MSRYFSFVALVIIAFVSDKAITIGDDDILVLNKFNQNDCITSCIEGLNNCTDRIVMNGSVKWNLSPNYPKVLTVEVRKKDSETLDTFCTIEKSNCKGYTSKDCYCQKVNTSYIIVINTTAEKHLSQAEFLLSLKRKDETDLASLSRQIPKIYDCNDVELSMNNHEIDNHLNRFHLADTKPNIKFCCTNTPTPCQVSLLRNEFKKTGTKCVSYHQKTKEPTEYKFEYVVCNGRKKRFSLISKASGLTIDTNTLQWIQYLTLLQFLHHQLC